MKKRNGHYYRKIKTQMGKTFWVRMSREEVMANDLYWLLVTMMPLVMILVMAWAAGMI